MTNPEHEPLSPEEMYRTLTSRTAFREGVRGERLLGHGNATRAILQVIDSEGHRRAIIFGRNNGQIHAEEHALVQLRRLLNGPDGESLNNSLRNGRLVVVVNQHVCGERCAPALRQFANEHRLQKVDSHVFVRPSVTSATASARPRRTFTTQTSPSVEGLTMRREDHPIYRSPPPSFSGGSGNAPRSPLPSTDNHSSPSSLNRTPFRGATRSSPSSDSAPSTGAAGLHTAHRVISGVNRAMSGVNAVTSAGEIVEGVRTGNSVQAAQGAVSTALNLAGAAGVSNGPLGYLGRALALYNIKNSATDFVQGVRTGNFERAFRGAADTALNVGRISRHPLAMSFTTAYDATQLADRSLASIGGWQPITGTSGRTMPQSQRSARVSNTTALTSNVSNQSTRTPAAPSDAQRRSAQLTSPTIGSQRMQNNRAHSERPVSVRSAVMPIKPPMRPGAKDAVDQRVIRDGVSVISLRHSSIPPSSSQSRISGNPVHHSKASRQPITEVNGRNMQSIKSLSSPNHQHRPPTINQHRPPTINQHRPPTIPSTRHQQPFKPAAITTNAFHRNVFHNPFKSIATAPRFNTPASHRPFK